MTKTISVLGCGWLGLPLAKQLVKEGFQVKGSTTSPSKVYSLEEAQIQPYVFKVKETFEGEVKDFFEADLLVLNIPPGRRNPNVETDHPLQVELVVKEAIKGGIQQLVFISSSSVYGAANDIVTETTIPAPSTGSGRALVKAERWLQEQAIAVTILRMAGLFGPKRHPARFLAGKKDLKNAAAPINLVQLDDAVAAILSVIQQEKWGTLYNVCADEHPHRKDYYTQKAAALDLVPPTFLEEEVATYKIVANQKIKAELGLTFKVLN